MKYFLLVISLALSLGAFGKECGECCSKHFTQKANEVVFFESADNLSVFHVGYYLGGQVVTVWQGIDEGKQDIYLLGNLAYSSTKYTKTKDGFTHFHENFKVCSTSKSQCIRQFR